MDALITEKEFADVFNSRYRYPVYSYLKNSCIGVAGLGGLGSHMALALARSGIGHLVLADFDRVELSNINRQAYRLEHIGQFKSNTMQKEINNVNPFCCVTAPSVRLTPENIGDIFESCEIVCEAFDEPEQKAMLADFILTRCPDKILISASGMAGFGNANSIVTRKVTDHFYICGDETTDLEQGDGLTAARVMICAGHQASKAIELILHKNNFYRST